MPNDPAFTQKKGRPVSMTPEQRTARARLAAHSKWATQDPVEGTAAARAAFLDRFEREVDPDGTLDPAERARRAEHARKAYFQALALKSAKARQAKRKAQAPRPKPVERTAAMVEVELVDIDLAAGEVTFRVPADSRWRPGRYIVSPDPTQE